MIDKYRIPDGFFISEAQQLAHHPLGASIYKVLGERQFKLKQELNGCAKDEFGIITEELILVEFLLKKSEKYYKEVFYNQSMQPKQFEL